MAIVRYDQRYSGAKLVQLNALDCENDRVRTQTIRIDCGEKALTTSDTGYVVPVAPYIKVISSSCEIVTAEGATATGDFGILGDDITNDPNGLDDAVNFNATAGTTTVSVPGTDAGLHINFDSSGGYITIVTDNDLDTAVLDLTLVYTKSQPTDLLNQ